MKNRTLFTISPMMGLLLLPLGCGILGPRTLLAPSELCSDHGNSAIATFEDPNLERAVREQSGVGAQDDLTCGLVSGFEAVSFAGYGITSLVGIQNLTNLESLYLFNNSISDIGPLSGLTRLAFLTLSKNSITDISPLGGITRLRELELRDNSITDISVLGGLTRLTSLFLDNNSITDINPLSGLTGLVDLPLRNNSITDISALGGLTRLYNLDLSNNTSLANIQPLLDNPGLGPRNPGILGRDVVNLGATNVSCADVALLQAKGVRVIHTC